LGKDTIYHSIVAAGLAAYNFNRYKNEKKDEIDEISLFFKNKYAKKQYDKAMSIVKGVYVARDIGNMPPQDMNPAEMEKYLRDLVKTLNNVRMEVLDEKRLEKDGFNGIISVGKGSDVPPRLFVLKYRGGGKNTIALVGKAVTFDAGGLDIKSREGMDEMKYDKCGGGVMVGALVALSLMKAKINLVVYVPAVENLPGPRSYKPRDVIKMYNGKTVEVTNTDAEGRLILADAIAYASEKKEIDTIIDAATLTGAVIVALGNKAAGIFGTNNKMIETIMRIGEEVGERYWRLPLYDEFLDDMKSDVADLVNSGGREGGASLAAIFLKEFTGGKPWVHLDIAGVAWVQKKGPKSPLYPQGATGYGVETLALVLGEKQV
jgi:leucyl aminopeptidase